MKLAALVLALLILACPHIHRRHMEATLIGAWHIYFDPDLSGHVVEESSQPTSTMRVWGVSIPAAEEAGIYQFDTDIGAGKIIDSVTLHRRLSSTTPPASVSYYMDSTTETPPAAELSTVTNGTLVGTENAPFTLVTDVPLLTTAINKTGVTTLKVRLPHVDYQFVDLGPEYPTLTIVYHTPTRNKWPFRASN